MSETGTQTPEVRIHRYVGSAMPVNAYLVETAAGVVVVDSTLTVSDARGLRERAAAPGKPLRAVLITHAHPDHYGGCVELVGSDEIPIVAATGVDAVIRRDDAIKERIIRPMFGDEWPRERRFPNRTIGDGESISLDGVSFTLTDLGPDALRLVVYVHRPGRNPLCPRTVDLRFAMRDGGEGYGDGAQRDGTVRRPPEPTYPSLPPC